MLKGKHIVLGISGGIAAYKSAYLLRLLIKKGAEVQVVITPNGKEFITPATLAALSGKPVVSDFFTANTGEWHSHVDLGLWADLMVIAPATACTIGKMAHGIADNMLITTYLSAKEPVMIAPAMDLDMWKHPSTQDNITLLKRRGNIIIEPKSGELASGLVGKGRMEEPDKIVEAIESFFAKSQSLRDKKILITAGPTYENIDPVRFIGNYSSGKMGFAIAEECAVRGGQVTLITGPVALTTPQYENIKRIKVISAKEMHAACMENFTHNDIIILAAAVADYAPDYVAEKKIKREGVEDMVIHLVKNPDIAATLGSRKLSGQIMVGFALETDNELENALKKLNKKNLDWIVLNSLRDAEAGFMKDTNKITMISSHGQLIPFDLKSKRTVAKDIIDTILTQK
ncbi:MAG: bifunctional phosphopantothenoylcysteine decarboxylase/phosphopantothenate--cysteine ligase CoaBC [Bacteroides sp.]|nr:bifunctional phosphopantothenoylcysteine decarboxylase/phosphopantothenate--cysteine ligase CoaBC [Bacteroides sp.]